MMKIRVTFIAIFCLVSIAIGHLRAMEIADIVFKKPLFSCEEELKLLATIVKASGNDDGKFNCIGCINEDNGQQDYLKHLLSKHIPSFKCRTCAEPVFALSWQDAQDQRCNNNQCHDIDHNDDCVTELTGLKQKIEVKILKKIEENLNRKGWGLDSLRSKFLSFVAREWNYKCNMCSVPAFTKDSVLGNFKNHMIDQHLGLYRCVVCKRPLKGQSKARAARSGPVLCKMGDVCIGNKHIIETIPFKIEELAEEWNVLDAYHQWQREESACQSEKATKVRKKRKRQEQPLFSCEEELKLLATIVKASDNDDGRFKCVGCINEENNQKDYMKHLLSEHLPCFKCKKCGDPVFALSWQYAQDQRCNNNQFHDIDHNDDCVTELAGLKQKIEVKIVKKIEEQLNRKGWGLDSLQNKFLNFVIECWKNECKLCENKKFVGKKARTVFKNHIISQHLTLYRCLVCKTLLKHDSKACAARRRDTLPCKVGKVCIGNQHIVETIPFSQAQIEALAEKWNVLDAYHQWQRKKSVCQSEKATQGRKRKREEITDLNRTVSEEVSDNSDLNLLEELNEVTKNLQNCLTEISQEQQSSESNAEFAEDDVNSVLSDALNEIINEVNEEILRAEMSKKQGKTEHNVQEVTDFNHTLNEEACDVDVNPLEELSQITQQLQNYLAGMPQVRNNQETQSTELENEKNVDINGFLNLDSMQ